MCLELSVFPAHYRNPGDACWPELRYKQKIIMYANMVIMYTSLPNEEVMTAFLQSNRSICAFWILLIRYGLKILLIHSILCPWFFPLFLFTDKFLPRGCFFRTSLLIFPNDIRWGLLVLTHVHEKQPHFCASPAIGEGCVINSSPWKDEGKMCVPNGPRPWESCV